MEQISTQLQAMALTFDSQTLAAMLTMHGAKLWKGLRLVGSESPESLEGVAKLFRDSIFEAGAMPAVVTMDEAPGRVQ